MKSLKEKLTATFLVGVGLTLATACSYKTFNVARNGAEFIYGQNLENNKERKKEKELGDHNGNLDLNLNRETTGGIKINIKDLFYYLGGKKIPPKGSSSLILSDDGYTRIELHPFEDSKLYRHYHNLPKGKE